MAETAYHQVFLVHLSHMQAAAAVAWAIPPLVRPPVAERVAVVPEMLAVATVLVSRERLILAAAVAAKILEMATPVTAGLEL
jgi:hypothetical protein